MVTSDSHDDSQQRRMLRLEDLADRLAISRSMAHKLIATGQVRSVRIGRSVRIRPSDLDSYLAHPDRERWAPPDGRPADPAAAGGPAPCPGPCRWFLDGMLPRARGPDPQPRLAVWR